MASRRGQKTKGQGGKGVRGPETYQNVQKLAEDVEGGAKDGKTSPSLTKSEATLALWSLAVQSQKRRAEIVKAGCLTSLVNMVESSSKESRLAACGCMDAILGTEGAREQIFPPEKVQRFIATLARILIDPHDRSRVYAASLLAHATEEEELTREAANNIETLVEALRIPDPGFRVAQERAKGFTFLVLSRIASYCPKSEGQKGEELPYRKRLLERGAAESALAALEFKDVDEAMSEVGTAAHEDAMLRRNNAAVLLGSLVGDDNAVEVLLDPDADTALDTLFALGLDEGATPSAKVAGVKCLEALASKNEREKRIAWSKGGVEFAVSILLEAFSATSGNKRNRKKKAVGKMSRKKAAALTGDDATQAARSACSALHHLSSDDNLRQAMLEADVVPPLMRFVRSSTRGKKKGGKKVGVDLHVFHDATGCLANFGMDSSGSHYLHQAGAPKYLREPVHWRWQSSDRSASPPSLLV